MKTLSEFLIQYLKDYLFNGGKSLDKPETFDEQLQRVLHQGIYMYRRKLSSSPEYLNAFSPGFILSNALIDAESGTAQL